MKKQWILDKIKEEALKYNSRGEFRNKNGSAYNAARKLRILDEVCTHMPKHVDQTGANNPFFKWSKDKIQQEALKYSNRNDFAKNAGSAYNAAKRMKILEEVCFHMSPSLTAAWAEKELHEQALKYKTRGEFKKNNPGAYRAAVQNEILDKICSHMQKVYKSFSEKELKEEALKYNTKTEFQNKNRKAYSAAYNKGILDKICSHMEDAYLYWSIESVQVEALKYDTRTKFYKGNGSAYNAALRWGILEKICKHMKKPNNSSDPEVELISTIKTVFPKAIKLRDRKVKIKDKLYIKGFDIDIFIPELNKGIEFDGKWYHSFKYMRKDKMKKDWTDEDIKNYDQLKDNWFLSSKGIKIIHIKEKDWIKNKEACIKRCLDFLKS